MTVQRSNDIGRELLNFGKLAANRDDDRTIHSQCLDCCPADGRSAPNFPRRRPDKMVSPVITPWIEDRNQLICIRIPNRLPGRFTQRTRYAGERKVIRSRGAISSARFHVVNVKRGLLPFLRKPTVFSRFSGPLTDFPDKGNGNVTTCHASTSPAAFARSFMSDSMSASSVRASASRRFLGDSVPSQSCRSRSSCNRSCKAGGNRNVSQSWGRSSSITTEAITIVQTTGVAKTVGFKFIRQRDPHCTANIWSRVHL